jgi:hypothetical protein
MVDAIQGQRQVVIKSLEANYTPRARASPPPPFSVMAASLSSSMSMPSSPSRGQSLQPESRSRAG